MKEKQFLKKLLIRFLIILIVYTGVVTLSNLILTNNYSNRLFAYDIDSMYSEYEVEDLDIQLSNHNMEFKDFYKKNGKFYITLVPMKKGTTYLEVLNQEGESLYLCDYHISTFGTITNGCNGNFQHYRLHHFLMILLFTSISILLLVSFRESRRELKYSYHSIFCIGLGIWTSIITLVLLFAWIRHFDMLNTYNVLRGSGHYFILFTFIPLLIFSIALSVSNLSLIKHEGFSYINVLGIMISFVIIGGAIFYWFLQGLYPSGSEMIMRYYNTAAAVYATMYSVIECFLIGSIINGYLSATNNPSYDIDYIVILGCKIKDDGTLYPLIRGRVDRAIKFYHDQINATGKKAIFVPSGGKGNDECMAEGEAMYHYLVSQGIPEEDILVENKSKNTKENMLFSKNLIEQRTPVYKAAFSTTNYHVFRSGMISKEVDFDVDGMGAKTKWYFWPNAYIREVIGMMAFKWKAIVLLMIPIVAFMVAIQFMFN